MCETSTISRFFQHFLLNRLCFVRTNSSQLFKQKWGFWNKQCTTKLEKKLVSFIYVMCFIHLYHFLPKVYKQFWPRISNEFKFCLHKCSQPETILCALSRLNLGDMWQCPEVFLVIRTGVGFAPGIWWVNITINAQDSLFTTMNYRAHSVNGTRWRNPGLDMENPSY